MFGPTILDVAIRKDNLNIRRNTMSSIKRFMQFLLMLCLLCGFILLTALHLFAQGTNSTIPIPVVPSGFDWWYIVLFAAGMVIHFIVHVIKTADLRTLVKTFLSSIRWLVFQQVAFYGNLLRGGSGFRHGCTVEFKRSVRDAECHGDRSSYRVRLHWRFCI